MKSDWTVVHRIIRNSKRTFTFLSLFLTAFVQTRPGIPPGNKRMKGKSPSGWSPVSNYFTRPCVIPFVFFFFSIASFWLNSLRKNMWEISSLYRVKCKMRLYRDYIYNRSNDRAGNLKKIGGGRLVVVTDPRWRTSSISTSAISIASDEEIFHLRMCRVLFFPRAPSRSADKRRRQSDSVCPASFLTPDPVECAWEDDLGLAIISISNRKKKLGVIRFLKASNSVALRVSGTLVLVVEIYITADIKSGNISHIYARYVFPRIKWVQVPVRWQPFSSSCICLKKIGPDFVGIEDSVSSCVAKNVSSFCVRR